MSSSLSCYIVWVSNLVYGVFENEDYDKNYLEQLKPLKGYITKEIFYRNWFWEIKNNDETRPEDSNKTPVC